MSFTPLFFNEPFRHKERERTGAAKIQWEPLVMSTRFDAHVSTKRPPAWDLQYKFLIHTIDRLPETRSLLFLPRRTPKERSIRFRFREVSG